MKASPKNWNNTKFLPATLAMVLLEEFQPQFSVCFVVLTISIATSVTKSKLFCRGVLRLIIPVYDELVGDPLLAFAMFLPPGYRLSAEYRIVIRFPNFITTKNMTI